MTAKTSSFMVRTIEGKVNGDLCYNSTLIEMTNNEDEV